MDKSLLKVILSVGLLTVVNKCVTAHPADHREDTVLPFSLSPGNVNLETYYLDKYPKPGPGGQLKKEPEPKTPELDGNAFLARQDEGPGKKDPHAIFRTRRRRASLFPRHDYPYHSRRLNYNYGHEQQQTQHETSFGYERHHQSNRYHQHYQPLFDNYSSHFHG